MFDKSDKRRLYTLIDCYLLSEIDPYNFCIGYKKIFAFDIPYDTLTELEQSVFTNLGIKVNKILENPNILTDSDGTYELFFATREAKNLLFQEENALYSSNDKIRLYWLMNQFLLKNIEVSVFCDEFYRCFDLNFDYTTLSPLEENALTELSTIVARFSSFEQDIKKHPGTYFTEYELNEAVMRTRELVFGKIRKIYA